jgi:hypothetical protein
MFQKSKFTHYGMKAMSFTRCWRTISPLTSVRAGLRWLLVGCFVCLLVASQAEGTQAHGAIVIDSGSVEAYAWTLSVSPYPITPGPTSLSLLVFNNQSNSIVSNLEGEVYLAAPNSTEPCCKRGVHVGPFPLLTEPFQFPGDYIAYVPIDVVGPWTAQFQLKSPEQSFAITSKMQVVADEGNGPINAAMIAEEVAQLTKYTAQQLTEVAKASVALAYTSTATANTVSPLVSVLPTPLPSPLATPADTATSQAPPAPTPPPAGNGSNWVWLVGVGIVLVVGIGAFLMRQRAQR